MGWWLGGRAGRPRVATGVYGGSSIAEMAVVIEVAGSTGWRRGDRIRIDTPISAGPSGGEGGYVGLRLWKCMMAHGLRDRGVESKSYTISLGPIPMYSR